MNVASDVPAPSCAGGVAGGLSFGLRAKGLVLFILLTTYVVGAAVLLIGQALLLPESGGELERLIGVAIVVALLGLATFGAFLVLFLGRLAKDLGALQSRAVEVVAGYRGEALPVNGTDELSVLAQALNRMAATLDARERDILLARMENFHQERMSLLGGIAAGFAHEIGNPVAAISAMAAEACAARTDGAATSFDARLLESQAHRLSEVTRRMAVAAGSRSREAAPLMLGTVVQSFATLLAFDQRFRSIEMQVVVDPAQPLVYVAEDDIVQLLIYLAANSLEALRAGSGKEPRITLESRGTGAFVELSVTDNGCGMSDETLARAVEPFFTTKGRGRGNGLGLHACKLIADRAGGVLEISSSPGRGTRVACRLPALSL